MTCEEVRPMLSTYLDNELAAAHATAVRAHLDECAACRQVLDAMRATGVTLRQHARGLTAPDLLRNRVNAALRAARAGDVARPAARRRGTFWLVQLAAGIVIAVGSSVVTRIALRQQSIESDLAVHDVVASHVRSLMTHHLTDITSTDEHNVKPWFDGKVPFAPEVPRLDSAGFPLLGGRVDTVGHEAVAALVYGRRQHLINVFTWPAGRVPRAGEGLRSSTEHGYHVLRWTHGDMQFAAVSDLAIIDLEQFVDLFRRSHPATEADSAAIERQALPTASPGRRAVARAGSPSDYSPRNASSGSVDAARRAGR